MIHPIRRPLRWRVVFTAIVVGAIWIGAAASQGVKPVYSLQVDGLACPFCAYGIEKQLNAVEGVEAVETEIRSGTIIVTMKTGATLDEAVAHKAVEAAGFTLRGFKRVEPAK